MADPAPHRRYALLVLAVVLAWGCYLRLANLGLNTLASDEMNHYFVGQALQHDRGPILPSGARYTRGIEYSALVSRTLPRFDVPEIAVRLPSAIIGSLALILFAAVAWAMGGPWTAVFATILFAIYPEALRLSRFGRFYTLQMLAGMIAMYAGWRLIRTPLYSDVLTRRRLQRDWGWAVLAGLAFAYATSVQVTTLSVVAGFGLFLAWVGLGDLGRLKVAAWKYSVPLQLTVAGVVIALGLVVFKLRLLEELFWRARAIPMWARLSEEGAGPMAAYYRALSNHFPLVVSLIPLIFLVAIARHPRTGGMLLAWFGVPLLLHSVVFGWKSERYVLVAVPALLIAAGIAAAAAMDELTKYFARQVENHPRLRSSRTLLPGLVTTIVLTATIVTQPAFNESRRSIHERRSAGWLESRSLIAADPALSSLPLGSASPLGALHYWGRLDFTVQQALLESWTRDTTGHDLDRPFLLKAVGSRDVYAGRPTLTTPDAIRERFSRDEAVLIGIDQKYVTFHNIDPKLLQALGTEAEELCKGQCGSMLLYRWKFRRG